MVRKLQQMKKVYFINLIIVFVIIVFHIIAIIARQELLNQIAMVLEGTELLFLLYCIIGYCSNKCGISLCVQDYIAILLMIIVSFIIYIVIVTKRDTVYIYDYACYYRKMIGLAEKYNSGIFGGIKEWITSGITDEYGKFLTIFIYPVFFFTDRSIEAFIISYFFCCVVPVMIVLYVFSLHIRKVFSNSEIKSFSAIKYVFAGIISLFPLIHAAAIKGQPDIFGLVFATIIILLTLPYDFIKRDYSRWGIILISTVALILTRRWYIFFVIGYYSVYFVALIIKKLFLKNMMDLKQSLINMLIFAGVSSSIGLVVFWKMIKIILNANYAEAYAAWNEGGLPFEVVNQIKYLGIFVFVLVVFGWIIGLVKKTIRFDSIVIILMTIANVVLFTRIQNMGYHQSLIMVLGYFFGVIVTTVFLYEKKYILLSLIPVCLVALSMISCTAFETRSDIAKALFSKISLYPEKRTDLEQIKSVVSWVNENIKDNERVFVLSGLTEYDPEVFVNYPTINSNKNNIVESGIVDSKKSLPKEFFEVKYIIIIDSVNSDIDANLISKVKNQINNNDSISSRFKKDYSILLKDNYEATIYERTQASDSKEYSLFSII